MAKFSLKEIQATRTRRPSPGSSSPYVEITLGELLAQGITQLQLEQVGAPQGHPRVYFFGGTGHILGCPAGLGAVPRGGRTRGEAAGRAGEEADAAAQRDHPALRPPQRWMNLEGGFWGVLGGFWGLGMGSPRLLYPPLVPLRGLCPRGFDTRLPPSACVCVCAVLADSGGAEWGPLGPPNPSQPPLNPLNPSPAPLNPSLIPPAPLSPS